MRQVTIEKSVLIQVLRENKEKHEKDYADSVEVYKTAALKYYKDLLDHANKDPMNMPFYDPPVKPVSHAKDYYRAIDMLEYEVADVITLSSQEFAQFVKDEWLWKNDFVFAMDKNSTYLQ